MLKKCIFVLLLSAVATPLCVFGGNVNKRRRMSGKSTINKEALNACLRIFGVRCFIKKRRASVKKPRVRRVSGRVSVKNLRIITVPKTNDVNEQAAPPPVKTLKLEMISFQNGDTQNNEQLGSSYDPPPGSPLIYDPPPDSPLMDSDKNFQDVLLRFHRSFREE